MGTAASDASDGGSIPLVPHLSPLRHDSKNAGKNKKPYEQTDHLILHVVDGAERGRSALLTSPQLPPGRFGFGTLASPRRPERLTQLGAV